MRPQIAKHLFLAFLLAACGAGFVRAGAASSSQTVTPEQTARAVSTVMDYRRGWLDDPTGFEACSVRQAIGGSDDFASMIAPQVRAMLDSMESRCPYSPGLDPRVVLVDSVRLAESAVFVYTTVRHGELIHREIHELDPQVAAPYMGVREVRLWGNVQIYPIRPKRSDAPSSR